MSDNQDQFTTVARASEIAPGDMRCVEICKRRITLANVDGEYFAFDDVCTHEEAYLSEGELFGDTVECPMHGAAFNVRTGAVESFPATVPLQTYPVRLDGDDVQIAVAEDA
jgi:3-phenylpropionate/trans-cinnamate dioxygenase ferredoxin subunit